MEEQRLKRCRTLFALALIFVALSGGFSGSIFSNYFRDAFDVTALQRGFLETPRESGGLICVVLFLVLGALGDVALGVVAQLFMALGLLVMAFLSPGYQKMVLFLFVYSLGQHLFMPVNDSIGMSLAQEGKSGGALGHFKKYSDLFAMAAGLAVFVGFRTGMFSFTTPVVAPFALAVFFSLAAAVLLLLLARQMPHKKVKNDRFALRREYWPYYLVTFAYGCQKRIRIVFGPWLLVELLGQGADTIAILTIASRFVSGLVAPRVGRFLDEKGLKLSLQAEAAYMTVIFVAEGLLAGGLAKGTLRGGVWFWVACAGFILTNIIDQFQMVHSLLMKQLCNERREEVTANLSLGISIDHIMAIAISPVLGLVWTGLGPQWVFYITAVSVVGQLFVAKFAAPAGGCKP